MSLSQVIETKLTDQLNPVYLKLTNESHKHHVPEGSESHFQLVIVCDRFEGLSLIEQHQMVYKILAEELSGKVHALSISSHTPSSWKKTQKIPRTPHCPKK